MALSLGHRILCTQVEEPRPKEENSLPGSLVEAAAVLGLPRHSEHIPLSLSCLPAIGFQFLVVRVSF